MAVLDEINWYAVKRYKQEQSYEYKDKIEEEIQHEVTCVKLRKFECAMEILPNIDYDKIASVLNYLHIKIKNDTQFDNNDFIKDITTISTYTGKHIQILINEYVKIAINRYLTFYYNILRNAISNNQNRDNLYQNLNDLVITYTSNCINIVIDRCNVKIEFVPFTYTIKESDCATPTFANSMSDYYEGKLIRDRLLEPTKEVEELAKKYTERVTLVEVEDCDSGENKEDTPNE